MKIKSHLRSAFTLVETTLALALVTFCVEAVLGLLPLGVNSENISIQQTRAAGIASAIASDLQATPLNSGTSQVFGLKIPAGAALAAVTQAVFLARDGNLSSATGQIATSGISLSMYRATITFPQNSFVSPAGTTNRTATMVRVFVTWPALADSNPASAPVNYAGSFETFTTLNRN